MAAKRVKRPTCAAKFCNRPQIKYSVYCREHAQVRGKCVVIGCDNPAIPQNNGACAEHNKSPKADPTTPEVLTALCAAVAAKYKDQGDHVKAGLVISELQHNPPRFYASVARYPHSPMDKKVVCKVGSFAATEIYTTAEAAVYALATRWAEENRPAPVQETMATLDNVLEG